MSKKYNVEKISKKLYCNAGHGDDTLVIFSSDNGIPFPLGKATYLIWRLLTKILLHQSFS